MKIYSRTENRARANIRQHATHANGKGPLCGCGVGMDDCIREGKLSDVHCRRCLQILNKKVAVTTQPKALIIDDDPDLRSHLVQMFKLDGYEVREALHGREALALLNKQDFVPDVILSDYDMPLVTGSELYRLICQVHPTLEPRFIMMSGSSKPRSFCKEF